MSKPGQSPPSSQFKIVKLDRKNHDRSHFKSGSEPLDEWFQRQAGQQMRSHAAVVYVAISASSAQIAGFYTLSASTVALADLDNSLVKKLKLPRYPYLPAVLLGRLAVDFRFHGCGLGKALLTDAMLKTKELLAELGAVALLVDAKDKTARDFYLHFGFIEFESDQMKLFMPAATISSL